MRFSLLSLRGDLNVRLARQPHRDHDDDRHDERDGRADVPVASGEELRFNDVADEDVLSAAEKLRNEEARHRGQEHERDAGDHAGKRERQRHAQECLHRRCTEVVGGFQKALVHLGKGRVNLQDHKGNEVIDHAEDDGKARVDHRHGADAEPRKDRVEDALVLQNAHPSIGAHQHVDPGRHGDEQN